jgi:hypothetical protein
MATRFVANDDSLQPVLIAVQAAIRDIPASAALDFLRCLAERIAAQMEGLQSH